MSRLKDKYQKEIVPKLMEEMNLENLYSVPRLEKIVLNMGVGEATHNDQFLEKAMEDLALITGQKPIKTKAKKAISGFKIRKGHTVGTKVTLRGERMYEFFDKLVNIVLSRMRDFRGVSKKSFDGCGNYSIGLPEQTIFIEIDPTKVDRDRSLEVSIVTTAKRDSEGEILLRHLGMPFKREEK